MYINNAWEQSLLLDDPGMTFFATVGEKKLCAAMLKSGVEDMVALIRYKAGEIDLPKDVVPAELEYAEAWVREDISPVTFHDCATIIDPDIDVTKLRRAILTDPVAALDRIRHMATFTEIEEEISAAVLERTEAEITAGVPHITIGRMGHALSRMLQDEPEHEAVDLSELDGIDALSEGQGYRHAAA